MTKPSCSIVLKVEPATLHRTGLGTICGRIYLQTNAGGFPAVGWSDIIVPVLSAWLGAVHSV
jgi:hypothetical protein